ncbi:MAG: tetratricopeptide repeat protein [Phycisphaerales bacterium]|jgi:tetratricopeptide (TPR) repeat protein|nr:tetratricopeptide repeat protein [Phycisphaerales bacterium]
MCVFRMDRSVGRRFSKANRVAVQIGAVLLVALIFFGAGRAVAQESKAKPKRRAVLDVDRQAKHLYDKAIELMEYKQYERGLAMLDTVIRDNQGNILGYRGHMAKGRHFLERRKTKEALRHFLLLSRLLAPEPGQKQTPAEIELHREALFQAGFAYYQSGQYSSAFPMFRRLTEVAGKSKWANMAYFYIGMSHYNLKRWNNAIDALELVGTEVEDAGDAVGRIEIGQRVYAKLKDADIPVMRKLGQDVKARVTVSSGDVEVLVGVPIAGKKNEMLASAPTQLGDAKKNDGVIQIHGGDTVTVTYLDESTLDGKKSVARVTKARAVSTGTIGFCLGDFSTPAYLAFPGQPQALVLRDADLDISPGAEKVTVIVKSLYKVDASDAGDGEGDDVLDIFAAKDKKSEQWKERDRIEVTLVEQGDGKAIRTGKFVGKIKLAVLKDGKADPKDDVLNCDELDELSTTYVDKVHVYGDEPRASISRIKVSGSVKSGVTADQYVVFESILKARKGAVEAEALNGLGAIYKDMGLDSRAKERANEALKRLNSIIMDRKNIPGELMEKAFKLKWESEILQDNFKAATATCMAFNRLYPESVLADQALMTLARGLAEKGQYDKAVEGYGRVLELQNPISAAEAQYRIGEVLQKKAETAAQAAVNSKWGTGQYSPATVLQRQMGSSIAAYRKTYETYPESGYAADSLSKVVRYYVDTDNNGQAVSLLKKAFSEFPDAEFLDEMLILWAKVAHKMGDTETTKTKLRQLIFDYPSSKHVAEARKKLQALGGK